MLLFITVFSLYGYAFHPYRENTVGAQGAQSPLCDIRGPIRIFQTAVLKLARTAARPRGSAIFDKSK